MIAYLFSSVILLSTIVFSAFVHFFGDFEDAEGGRIEFFNIYIKLTYVIAQIMFLFYVYYLIFYIRRLIKIRKYKNK